MAGIDELRAKAIASMKASGSLKPNKLGNPSNGVLSPRLKSFEL